MIQTKKRTRYHNRFKEAAWYRPGVKVVVGGAGGIGSWLCILLSRIGCNIGLYEMDYIDSTNMAGQLYPVDSINKKKAEVIVDLCKSFSEGNVAILNKLEEDSQVLPVTFSAFDNMQAREQMFNAWCKLKNREVFIDGRMLIETGQIFCVQKDQEERYREYLFKDVEIPDIPCSHKATSHSGAIIASLMVSIYNNFVYNQVRKMDIREVPFRFDYELHTLNFEEYDTTNS